MADVVDQSESFSEVFVQTESSGSGAGDLCDLDGVGETAAEVVGGATGKDLGFPCQSPKGTCLHDALAITLERRTRGTDRCGIDAGQQEIVPISCYCASMEIDCHRQIKV
jgi:hypothetical protein